MTTQTDDFTTQASPEQVLDSVEELIKQEGWKFKDRDGNEIQAKQKVNMKTWGDSIEVSADALAEGGTRVRVVVHSWQLVDWGSNDQVAAKIRQHLGG